MANSAMVRSITRNVGSTSHNSIQSDHAVTRSSGAKAWKVSGKAWKISGKLWKVREYQNSLQHLSQTPEGQSLYLITIRPGESGLAGVVNGRLIPSQVI